MNVYLPYPKSKISQRFGYNANPLYAAEKLKGHTSYDWDVPYGTPILNCIANAYCYSVLNKDSKDPDLYKAAYFLVEDAGIYEVSYGHMSTVLAEVGKTYQVGEPIGLVGNTGPVYSGDHFVTKAEKLAGSHAGSHLHGPQIRPVKKSRHTYKYEMYLYDNTGRYTDKDGNFYQVLDYYNGYNGCVSLAPFSTETVVPAYIPAPPVSEIKVTVPYVEAVASAKRWNSGSFLQMVLSILKGKYKK